MDLGSDFYGMVRSNILSLDPLSSLNKLYVFVIREELQQAMTKGMDKYNRDLVKEAAFKATVSINRGHWGNNLPKNSG